MKILVLLLVASGGARWLNEVLKPILA
jgi:hypothetical protein